MSFSLPKFLRRVSAENLRTYFDERGYERAKIDWERNEVKFIEHIWAVGEKKSRPRSCVCQIPPNLKNQTSRHQFVSEKYIERWGLAAQG